MIITYGFFVLFTFFIFIVNFLLIMRAWIIHKEDKFVNEETPKISILVPAYNEAVGIVDSIDSLLNQDYKNYEIIVVDDGSTDDTYGVLKDCFKGNKEIQIYTKPNSGKSETLNFAATKAKGKYFMCIDADTILVPHAIRTMIGKKKPGVDAVSAMVGIHNEYIMKNGIPEKTSVPKSLSTRMQWMEYCRSYVVFRCSMKDKNVITVISGACGLISREIFDKCGGYKKEQLGEDMELTLNIHTNDGVIQFIPETLAWTEAPTNIKDLGTQRVRWFRGALQAFLEHPGLMLGKNNFTFRWLLLPYIWISDVLGVWVEIAAWAMLTYIIVTHAFIDWYVFAIIWAAIMFAHYINSLLIMFFVKYKLEVNYTSMYRAVVMALFEGLTYHFLYLYWLIKAHLQQLFRTSKKWNKLDRVGLKK